jgi:hypothetical protein
LTLLVRPAFVKLLRVIDAVAAAALLLLRWLVLPARLNLMSLPLTPAAAAAAAAAVGTDGVCCSRSAAPAFQMVMRASSSSICVSEAGRRAGCVSKPAQGCEKLFGAVHSQCWHLHLLAPVGILSVGTCWHLLVFSVLAPVGKLRLVQCSLSVVGALKARFSFSVLAPQVPVAMSVGTWR